MKEEMKEEPQTDAVLLLAKKIVDYERQVALFGKERADTVLQFWVLGYRKCIELNLPIMQELTTLRSRVKELEEELKDARSKITPMPVSKWLSCHLCLYECATPDEMRNHLTNEHGFGIA